MMPSQPVARTRVECESTSFSERQFRVETGLQRVAARRKIEGRRKRDGRTGYERDLHIRRQALLDWRAISGGKVIHTDASFVQ